MISFPYAKINLGLHIVSKRDDGFHNLETSFLPIKLHDVLEIVPSDKFVFNAYGIKIAGNTDDNLCVKAYRLLKKIYNIPAVEIHLIKKIPFGAGLGGGSSDAAFTLMSLNELFYLDIKKEKLQSFARELGADCAYFIEDKKVQYATGRGDVFQEINLQTEDFNIIIAKPDFNISTKEAFFGMEIKKREYTLFDNILKGKEHWKNNVKNDFEESIFAKYPALAGIKEYFYQKGAFYSSLSGSGSSVYGLFEKKIDIQELGNPFVINNLELYQV
jgi:4-diphosphocytidyl-2-C-methyl-D-erythritol kinase